MAEDTDHNDHWQDDDTGNESTSPDDGRSFFSTWGWPLFGLAAFVIFELTASLMWSSLVFALRFGWKDVYAGWFFWRRDTLSIRGMAIGLLLFSSATIRMSFAGLLVAMAIGFLSDQFGQGNAIRVEDALRSNTALFLGGIAVSVLVFLIAVILCHCGRTKVWIDRQSYLQACSQEWPPNPWFTFNRADFLCFLSMIPITGIVFVLSFFLPLFWLANGGGQNVTAWAMLILASSSLLTWGCFVPGRGWISRSVTARTPQECWPELTPPQDDLGDQDGGAVNVARRSAS